MSDLEKPQRDKKQFLEDLVRDLVASYQSESSMQHLDSIFLPNRQKTIEIIERLRKLVFPGFFDEQRITSENVSYHVGELLVQTHDLLYEQVHQAMCYGQNERGETDNECDQCCDVAMEATEAFMRKLPELREILADDVRATFDGDPASASTDENIFCYPGIDAIFTYRMAHELYKLNVPLLPRIMTEYAHNETGIDIHPGATIGRRFCIDHGTGIVIGETCDIGNNVKIYQGVTLGALSTKGGQDWKGMKRHPKIEDNVTIYGGAIILGGSTTIGESTTIGGAVFITQSIPSNTTVSMDNLDLKIKPKRERKNK
ncbi:Serine acetyltransferase [Poriferisphaera corsica]|uniref:Serine acetyltransferase n=1 Tax=Poriferisphaera corsica TaxID=2528020 RepID=A0A517YSU9_9BACT|nr:serine acetyltransferase [Poriferisphaera corsica]QDU33310.1 Serine acetyltransferase [Poriferisphaera corsica]